MNIFNLIKKLINNLQVFGIRSAYQHIFNNFL